MTCPCQHTEKSAALCVICDSKLFGRSDKRFCSSKCKNRYHAEIRKTNRTVSKETLKVLYRNYRILSSLMSRNCSKYQVSKLVLQQKGFDPETITGMEYNKFGIRLKVFDFYWYLSANNTIVVSRMKHESAISPFVYKRLKRFGPSELAA